MELGAFEGVWDLEKRIIDARAGTDGRFSGMARFTAVPGGLSYLEEGRLSIAGAAPMTATRRYFWRAAGPAIEVDFDDGRFFHAFPTGTTRAGAGHFCDPDQYHVRYDFTDWPVWRAEWQVSGPRKDYRMVSDYRRAGQAGALAP